MVEEGAGDLLGPNPLLDSNRLPMLIKFVKSEAERLARPPPSLTKNREQTLRVGWLKKEA